MTLIEVFLVYYIYFLFVCFIIFIKYYIRLGEFSDFRVFGKNFCWAESLWKGRPKATAPALAYQNDRLQEIQDINEDADDEVDEDEDQSEDEEEQEVQEETVQQILRRKRNIEANQQRIPLCDVCGSQKIKRRYWYCPKKCVKNQ